MGTCQTDFTGWMLMGTYRTDIAVWILMGTSDNRVDVDGQMSNTLQGEC